MALQRYGQLLRAILGGPDPGSLPAPSEVIPTLELGRGPLDHRYPRGLFSYVGYVLEAAGGAGTRSKGLIYLPADTTTLAVIERIEAYSTDDVLMMSQPSAGAGGNPATSDGTERARDFRLNVGTFITRNATCEISSVTAAGQLGSAMTRLFPHHDDGTTYSFKVVESIVVWPGTYVCIAPVTDNVAITVNFWWYERQFELEELRGVRAGYFK